VSLQWIYRKTIPHFSCVRLVQTTYYLLNVVPIHELVRITQILAVIRASFYNELAAGTKRRVKIRSWELQRGENLLTWLEETAPCCTYADRIRGGSVHTRRPHHSAIGGFGWFDEGRNGSSTSDLSYVFYFQEKRLNHTRLHSLLPAHRIIG